MFIVVEGCDGVGKTTLCDALETRLSHTGDVRRIHFGPPERHPLLEYEADFDWYRPDDNVHVIIDRLHWGEAIYGPLYRGKSLLGQAGLDHIDRYISSRGGIIVFMDANDEVVRYRLASRGEDYLKNEHVAHVMAEYRNVASKCLTSVLNVVGGVVQDYTVTDVIQLAHVRSREALGLSSEFPTYVGRPFPNVLLLGERRNDLRHAAAFVPYPATSGRFLLEAIRSRPHGIGLANALECNVSQLYSRMNQPAVVALGNEAYQECREWAIPCGAVPHPQYVRRFMHSRQQEYGQMIWKAATDRQDFRSWR